jgi:hypothetical protein
MILLTKRQWKPLNTYRVNTKYTNDIHIALVYTLYV